MALVEELEHLMEFSAVFEPAQKAVAEPLTGRALDPRFHFALVFDERLVPRHPDRGRLVRFEEHLRPGGIGGRVRHRIVPDGDQFLDRVALDPVADVVHRYRPPRIESWDATHSS